MLYDWVCCRAKPSKVWATILTRHWQHLIFLEVVSTKPVRQPVWFSVYVTWENTQRKQMSECWSSPIHPEWWRGTRWSINDEGPQWQKQDFMHTKSQQCRILLTWLVVWNIWIIVHNILGMSSSQLTFIFFRWGRYTTNQFLWLLQSDESVVERSPESALHSSRNGGVHSSRLLSRVFHNVSRKCYHLKWNKVIVLPKNQKGFYLKIDSVECFTVKKQTFTDFFSGILITITS